MRSDLDSIIPSWSKENISFIPVVRKLSESPTDHTVQKVGPKIPRAVLGASLLRVSTYEIKKIAYD